MLNKFLLFFGGVVLGSFIMVFLLRFVSGGNPMANRLLSPIGLQKQEVIGFLPYWLIGAEKKNYEGYVSSLSYFSLSIGPDGKILKYTDDAQTETEPGWLALKSGKAKGAKSLVIFAADKERIDILMGDPVTNAKNLAGDLLPIIREHGFTDINIDIEDVVEASDSARSSFTVFSKTFHDEIKSKNQDIIISIDVSPIVLFKPYLTDLTAISKYYDKIIFMMYDFHFQNSSATGAVSPVNGGGISAEFDTEVSVKKALEILDAEKIIIGVPLYGYEWETLTNKPNAGVIPGTGITASNKRVEEFLEKCATCSATFDATSKESHLVYKDEETDTYHQIFFPDRRAMEEKVKLVKKYRLGGIALWAMGYEGKTILEPLKGL
ncbi:MAG: glycosyl hydrolase family 18 protein [Patescibacteria group bacterium]